MRKLSLFSSTVAVALLLSMLLCQVAVATPPSGTLLFSSGYGGDPGRDEVMFTKDDLDYIHVVNKVRESKISVLTVDCQPGTTGDYAIDAHNNFDYIATQTKGVHYYDTTPWQTIRDEIQTRIGKGMGDIVFIFDLTSSMSGIINTMKGNAKSIIDGLPVTVDVAFGVGSHLDYPHSYNSYGYAATYGGTSDYAWSLDQDITTDKTTAKGAIDALGLGWGADGPQNYARALHETQFYSWRHKATKIVVMCGDAPAHAAPSGLARATGAGWIASGDKKTFHLNARIKPSGPTGELQYVVHKGYQAGMRVDSVSIDSLSFHRTATRAGARITGTCEVDGSGGYTFVANVEDNGEPGKGVDFFAISVSGTGFSYSASGLLEGGNIQIHGP